MPIKWWTDVIIIYLYNGISFGHTTTCYNIYDPENLALNQRSQTQKAIYHMIPFI